jgi:hypothetical protein
MSAHQAEEFDCCECGGHIIRIIPDPAAGPLCATCIHMPGWFRDPRTRELLDADHDGREPLLEQAGGLSL